MRKNKNVRTGLSTWPEQTRKLQSLDGFGAHALHGNINAPNHYPHEMWGARDVEGGGGLHFNVAVGDCDFGKGMYGLVLFSRLGFVFVTK